MTTPDPSGPQCAHCGAQGEPGDRFCVQCRTAFVGLVDTTATVITAPQPESQPDQPDDDGTTRYLCAAAYLDPEFANDAIREFLVEPLRAVPPSPGLDASAVLRDAVAARTARKFLNGVLLGLLVIFLVLSPMLFVFWLVAAACVVALGGGFRGATAKAVLAVVGLLVVVAVLPQFLGLPRILSPFSLVGALSTSGAALAVGVVLGLVIVAVLVGWEVYLSDLTRNRFRVGFMPYAELLPFGWERSLRMLGRTGWQSQLARFDSAVANANAQGEADLIVYRTPSPFVGAGNRVAGDSILLPLVPDGEEDDGLGYPTRPTAATGATPTPFTASQLLDGVDAAVRALAASPSLSPSGRLRGVAVHEQIFVSARRLLAHPDAPTVQGVLRRNTTPIASVPLERSHRLTDLPDEVARQYRCYRVEAWNRDLTVSTFVTASTDGRMLYLEWQHCVLPPVQERFRSIDYADYDHPVLRALGEALVLPASAPARIAALFSRMKPLPVRPGVMDPAAYGAGKSLRELAAEPSVPEFFQRSDTQRYIQLFQRAVVRGLRDFLDAKGYSIETLQKITLNSLTITGGDQRGAVFGAGQTTQFNGKRDKKDTA